MRVIPLPMLLVGALAALPAGGCNHRRVETVREQPVITAAVDPARCTTQQLTSIAWPAEPSGPARLTVHVAQLAARQAATVGWMSEDGQRASILNPVYGAPVPTYQGDVPAERLKLYVDGLADSEGVAAHAEIDMRERKSAELNLVIDEARELLNRQVVLRDRVGQPIAGARGLPVLDGTLVALHNAVANFQQWISAVQGELRVRSIAGEPVRMSITVPLSARPVEATLLPGAQELRLDDITSVRCSFRCPANGKFSGYAGYVALAELADGSCSRFALEASDVVYSDDITLAWPQGTRRLTVSAPHYASTTITSPEQKCELHPLPERNCALWDY